MKQPIGVRSIPKAELHPKAFMIIPCDTYCFVQKSQNPQKINLTMTGVLELCLYIFCNSNGMRIIKIRSHISIYLATYFQINPSNLYFHSSSEFYYIDELVLWYSGHVDPALLFYYYPKILYNSESNSIHLSVR